MNTFKFPLVFNVSGIATHQEGTREYYSQLIANIAQVSFGDLPIRPDVGVPDTTFSTTGTFIPIVSAVTRTIPEILITSVAETPSLEGDTLGSSTISLDFEVINGVS